MDRAHGRKGLEGTQLAEGIRWRWSCNVGIRRTEGFIIKLISFILQLYVFIIQPFKVPV